jgi:hypothetical protein
MNIDEIRKQIREIESEIMKLKELPAIPKVTDEIHELYEIKWQLERSVLSANNAS